MGNEVRELLRSPRSWFWRSLGFWATISVVGLVFVSWSCRDRRVDGVDFMSTDTFQLRTVKALERIADQLEHRALPAPPRRTPEEREARGEKVMR